MHAGCVNGALPCTTALQIAGDYAGAIGGSALLALARPGPTLTRVFWRGLLVFAPIEFVQPRIGWVHYRRCRTEWWLPDETTWLLHALWDALLSVAVVWAAVVLASGRSDKKVAVVSGVLGMAQEVFLESNLF